MEKNIDFERVKWFAMRENAAYKNEEFIHDNFPNTSRVSIIKDIDVSYFLEIFPEEELQVKCPWYS